MTVVTISGQTGSGAREVGRLAAQRLEVDYIDQEILVREARALGVPVESVASRDERTASLGERLASMFRRFLERSAAAGSTDPMLGSGLDVVLSRTYGEAALEGTEDISDDDYLAALSSIVRDIAGQDDVLIIGRGSQVILRDWPGAFHTLLVAPLDKRIEFLVQRDGLTEEEARKLERERGRGRAAFHRKFFDVDVDDPSLYHLTVNTGRYSIEEAAQAVADAAEAAGSAQPSGAP